MCLNLDRHRQPNAKGHNTLQYNTKSPEKQRKFLLSQTGSFNYLNRHSIHFYIQDFAESLT